MDWLVEHWNSIMCWVGWIVTCASGAVKLTPTTKDDGIVDRVIKVLDYASIFNTKKDEAKLSK
ncbi:MAG: hypothetical protein J6S67_11310 [Methanobrevibacter sp.]|nr:hypothetical protein [Methanobrevibacter sp.]